jgi:hypothetical protein
MSETGSEENLITGTWADTLIRAMKTLSAAQQAIQEERAWVRKSLEDENAPAWLIELVLERW